MTVAGFDPGPGVCWAWDTPTHASNPRMANPAKIVLRKIIFSPANIVFCDLSRPCGELIASFRCSVLFRAPCKVRSRPGNSFPRTRKISGPAQPPRFFVLDFDHEEAVGRHSGAGFGAVAQFEQAVDVSWCQFSASNVE